MSRGVLEKGDGCGLRHLVLLSASLGTLVISFETLGVFPLGADWPVPG